MPPILETLAGGVTSNSTLLNVPSMARHIPAWQVPTPHSASELHSFRVGFASSSLSVDTPHPARNGRTRSDQRVMEYPSVSGIQRADSKWIPRARTLPTTLHASGRPPIGWDP